MSDNRERLEGIRGGEFLGDDDTIEIRVLRSSRQSKSVKGRRKWFGRQGSDLVCGPDGRLGWRARIPGSRPLASPAVTGDRVLVGGGFGSHEFHAFHADSGEKAWTIRTRDDGPTAAVAADGLLAFNTESCTVYVVEAESGRVVWERWLGDPLMAQPALSHSKVFMAYPDSQGQHRLAALDLHGGKTLWETELIADVITAPVVAEGSIYAATLDGTVYRIDPATGRRIWSIPHRATSAPWVHRGRIFLSLREEEEQRRRGCSVEGWDTVVLRTGARDSRVSPTRRRSPYLDPERSVLKQAYYAQHDAGVGFASVPGSAKLHMAAEHLGVQRVSSMWSYQGSRPVAFDDGIFGVMGDAIQRLDVETKKPLWRCRVEFDGQESLGRLLHPPAVTAGRLYVTSSFGDLFVLDRRTGEELWSLNVGSPILSQPTVAAGRVLVGTSDGTLYGFEADDPDPAGWPMWGGGPGHNGAGVANGAGDPRAE